jgi:hypothetical protein
MKTINVGIAKTAKVSDADFKLVSQYKWCVSRFRRGGGEYAVTTINRKMVYMHRMILSPGRGQFVDHKDGDGLNNARSNIRLCCSSENSRNSRKIKHKTSIYKGVHFNKEDGKWMCQIQLNGRRSTVGRYKTQEEAALAYNAIAKSEYGKYARLNVIGVGCV